MDSEALPAVPLAEWLQAPRSTAHRVPVTTYDPTGKLQETDTLQTPIYEDTATCKCIHKPGTFPPFVTSQPQNVLFLIYCKVEEKGY